MMLGAKRNDCLSWRLPSKVGELEPWVKMPTGAGVTPRGSPLARKWIARTERLENYGQAIYAMAAEGFNALEND